MDMLSGFDWPLMTRVSAGEGSLPDWPLMISVRAGEGSHSNVCADEGSHGNVCADEGSHGNVSWYTKVDAGDVIDNTGEGSSIGIVGAGDVIGNTGEGSSIGIVGAGEGSSTGDAKGTFCAGEMSTV